MANIEQHHPVTTTTPDASSSSRCTPTDARSCETPSARCSVSDEDADAVADALVGPVLPSSPVYQAYCEPVPESTRDMRGCVRLAVAL